MSDADGAKLTHPYVTAHIQLGHIISGLLAGLIPSVLVGVIYLYNGANSGTLAQLKIDTLSTQIAGISVDLQVLKTEVSAVQAAVTSISPVASAVPVVQASLDSVQTRQINIERQLGILRDNTNALGNRVTRLEAQMQDIVSSNGLSQSAH